jgi:hypothetical protein
MCDGDPKVKSDVLSRNIVTMGAMSGDAEKQNTSFQLHAFSLASLERFDNTDTA